MPLNNLLYTHCLTLCVQPSVDGEDLKSTAIFEELKKHVSSTPDIVRKVKAIFLWNITKAGKRVAQWSEYKRVLSSLLY